MDTRTSPDRRRTKPTTSIRHQVQRQDFREENLAPSVVSSMGNPNLEQRRPSSFLYGTANRGSKLLDSISRGSVGPGLILHARLTETSSLYGWQGTQTPGTELSQSDRSGEEKRLSQDAGFDVDGEYADDINPNSHCYRRAAGECFAACRKRKRLRYSQGLGARPHKPNTTVYYRILI